MTSSSSEPEQRETVVLNTYEDEKVLRLLPAPASEYNSDLHFAIEAVSSTVRATGSFQMSRLQMSAFVGQEEAEEILLFDENGDGSIRFTKLDSLGHYEVVIEVGGPWSDQAKISFRTDQTAVVAFLGDLTRALPRVQGI